ncbi:hypothetical protein MADA3029_p0062 [Vibrio nigripulchritudo MADA3029]|uniref:hypothetical protein n=1 Tax=Vibrio nigripulchritudo TaxID=28173 RepID=UPI0003B21B87|nr:hypothetical protein [Vibrio nigripulchritudo]CCN50829.1 hypothetical protein VIBNIMADA3020_p0062 [Vibrio nigripulchritudo MADA3020]CCN56687.1 hypothetical protein VIBNIMADA3021_p0062 [Vibrio nigripulchritudo MADA3021]CCN62544.1 hypothetical protein MADA3029_p0062 [Vibrio nigripulchritudo MADA3029]
MNKIQKLKVKNYKKKLLEKYYFLDIDYIYYGEENSNDLEFCKTAHNSDNGRYVRESIFIRYEGIFLCESEISDISKGFIRENIDLFNSSKRLTFTVDYHGENFMVSCDSSKFIDNYNNIMHLRKNPIIFSNDHRKLISVMRLEYEVELYILDRKS